MSRRLARSVAVAASAAAAALALPGCARPPSPPPASSRSITAPPQSTPATPPSPPGSTPATASATAGLAATDRLEQRHRLAQALPRATAHYRIDFTVGPDGRLALQVTLLAVLNDARDLPAYRDELRRYKAEALAFIGGVGDDPGTFTISYLPAEAAAL